MENKKLVPQIRFKGFSDKYEKNIIGNIMNVASVKRVHQAEWKSSGVRFLRARDIVLEQQGKNILEPLFISYELYEKNSLLSGKVKINDLLVTGVGTIGVPYLIKTTEPLYFKDGNIIWFQNHCLNGTFFYYLFLSPYIQNYIKKVAGIGTVGTYTIDSGKKTPIYYPNLKEQYLIGYFQNAIDTLISKKQMKLEKIKALKQTLLKKMFPNENSSVPEIRFKGFTENWEKKKLGNIGSTYNGLTGKSKDDFGHGNALYIPYLNIFNNPIIDNSKLEPIEIDFRQNKVLYGDIFFTTSSETPEEVGMSSVWLYNHDNIYLNSFCFGYRLKNINGYNLLFFTYLLRSLSVRKKIAILAQGISRYNISKTKLMNLKIKFPNKVEQDKIGKYFYKLDKLINLYEKEIEKLTNLKKAFLKKMFV